MMIHMPQKRKNDSQRKAKKTAERKKRIHQRAALDRLLEAHPMLRSVHNPPLFWMHHRARYQLDEVTPSLVTQADIEPIKPVLEQIRQDIADEQEVYSWLLSRGAIMVHDGGETSKMRFRKASGIDTLDRPIVPLRQLVEWSYRQ